MPQLLTNEEIFGRILRSTIGVIGRRTSEAYATVTIGNIIKKLEESYDFFRYISIKSIHFSEGVDSVDIRSEINQVDPKNIGSAINDLIRTITHVLGKETGYFFIKEIKEDLPSDYESSIRELGINLDFLQMEYITERKNITKFDIKNSEVYKHVFKTLYELLESEKGQRVAISTIREMVGRFSTEYSILSYVKVNDVSSIQNVDVITVDIGINSVDSDCAGGAIQKIIQEVNKFLGEKGGTDFIEKLKNYLTFDFVYRIEKMGVNLNVISLGHDLVVKNVLKALVDILAEATTQSYAILMINNVLAKTEDKFEFLKQIKIDSMRYSEGTDAIIVPENIDSIRPSDLGRSIQKVVENFVESLGEDAGQDFVEKFKKRLGKAYLLRIEEMGVNLHMIQLKRNLMW